MERDKGINEVERVRIRETERGRGMIEEREREREGGGGGERHTGRRSMLNVYRLNHSTWCRLELSGGVVIYLPYLSCPHPSLITSPTHQCEPETVRHPVAVY